jgi:hypothetical protein
VEGGRVALSDSAGRIETKLEAISPFVGLDKAENRRLFDQLSIRRKSAACAFVADESSLTILRTPSKTYEEFYLPGGKS